MATLNDNIARVKADFKAIKGELVNKGASIPSGTPTSQYANIIKNMSTGSSEEAYEQGRQDVIAESKYIPKQAIGKVISLTDVSEVAHKVKVYGDNQEVEVLGNNLFDISADTRFTEQADGSYVNNLTLLNDKTSFVLPYNTYVVSYDISCPVGKNARMEFTLGDGTTANTYVQSTGDFVHIEKAITGEIVNWYFGYSSRPLEGELIMRNVQIEVGSIATPYEPYTKQTITATPTGTEIPSMCPNMTFIADEEIKVDYYSSFGMQTEYDRFWDGYQNHGNRRDYGNAFAGAGWTDATFKPKYDIVVTSSGNLFLSSKITDIVKTLNECSVSLDTSNCPGFSYSMQAMISKSFPLLDLSANTSATTNLFNNCQNLEYIVGIVSSEKTKFHNMSFGNCPKLTHVIFSGVIASDINLQWSPLLDEESIISLIGVLNWYDSVEDGYMTKTITLHPDVWAKADTINTFGTIWAEQGDLFLSLTEFVDTKGWKRA